MTNREVVQAWSKGIDAHSADGNLHTDGVNLYSYRLKIGYTEYVSGSRGVINYTTSCGANNFQVAGYGYFHVTQTTSRHVHIAESVADFVINPVINQVKRS